MLTVLRIGIGLVPLFLLLACGPSDVEPDTGEVNVLTLHYWQAPSVPSPYRSGGYKDLDAAAITLEPLAKYDPDGNIIPTLAVEVPTIENGGFSPDLMSIRWKLKEGLKWSDGKDVTAEDVVFTWLYCSNEETGCTAESSFDGIASVQALDDLTVQINFIEPTPFPYLAFVGSGTPIISEEQFGDCIGSSASTPDCKELYSMPLGTGPFRITSFKASGRIAYERNPHYHGNAPYFDRIVVKSGGDATAAARTVLEKNDADFAWNTQVDPETLTEMQEAGLGTLAVAYTSLVERIVVNQTNPDPALGDNRSEHLDGNNPHPFLSFKPIRQAMSLAIDREQIASDLYGFAGKPTCNLITGPPIYVSRANDSCLTQDIEAANSLLDENDVVDTDGDGIREHEGTPLKITFQTSTNSIRQDTQALIRDWWKEIGIETELIDHDAGAFFGDDPSDASYRRFFADVQMFASGTGIDPQQDLSNLLCKHIPTRENNWALSNIARSCDPDFDALYAQLERTEIGREREDTVKRLNDLHVQNYFEIPLINRGFVSAHLNTLKGFRINGWDSELWNIGEWHR